MSLGGFTTSMYFLLSFTDLLNMQCLDPSMHRYGYPFTKTVVWMVMTIVLLTFLRLRFVSPMLPRQTACHDEMSHSSDILSPSIALFQVTQGTAGDWTNCG